MDRKKMEDGKKDFGLTHHLAGPILIEEHKGGKKREKYDQYMNKSSKTERKK